MSLDQKDWMDSEGDRIVREKMKEKSSGLVDSLGMVRAARNLNRTVSGFMMTFGGVCYVWSQFMPKDDIYSSGDHYFTAFVIGFPLLAGYFMWRSVDDWYDNTTRKILKSRNNQNQLL